LLVQKKRDICKRKIGTLDELLACILDAAVLI
jgi:hypothetical protein